MRVTNGMMIANMMRNITKNMGRMDKLQQNMATGKKFINPSDDPIGVSRSLRLNTDVSTMEQFKRNVDDAASWMHTTELATNNLISVLHRARELTVQASSSTNTVEERVTISAEIKQLKEQLINIGNYNYAGRYLFSGYKTDMPLLKPDGTYDMGGSALYSNEIIDFNIGIGDRLGINVVGQRIFGHAINDADLDANIKTGVIDYILKAGNTFAPAVLAGDNLDFSYNGNAYSISLTGDFTVPTGMDDVVTEINNQLSINPALKGHISANVEDGRINFISDAAFTINASSSNAATGMLGVSEPQSAVKAAHSLEGATVDLSVDSFTVTGGTSDQFVVNFNGADITLTLTAPKTYDGTAGNTMNDLAADIQSQINANGTLNGHVTVMNVNNRLMFYSDQQIALKNLDPVSFDQTSMGMIDKKSSLPLDKKVDSGAKTQLIGVFDQLIKDLANDDTSSIGSALTRLDMHMNNINAIRAEIGVKSNRIDLTTNRIADDTINLMDLLSKNEDADMAEVIMNLKAEENVYRSSLSAGAKIIQPSLIDFLR